MRNPLLVAATLIVGVVGVGFAAFRATRPTPDPTVTPVTLEDGGGAIAWCAPGLEPIAGGGCYAGATPDAGRPAPLLLYFHGMYERDNAAGELERQGRVARRATARGFAVLAVRGRLGQCATIPTWFCWPSNERTADAGPSVVQEWQAALRVASARGGSGKRYVLGFSNGAFFAGLLAVRSLFPADGFAIAHGGPVEPIRAQKKMPPLLLMSADDDPSQDGMLLLEQELTREGWAHENYAREGGNGHMLTDGDIDAALTFFIRTRTEKLPLVPPMSLHKPQPYLQPRATDAASPEAADNEGDPKIDNPY